MISTKNLLFALLMITQPLLSLSQQRERETIIRDYETRKLALQKNLPAYFSMADTMQNKEKATAMKFLLAYSPLSDIADLSPNFFYNQIKWAYMIKEFFPWEKNMPDEVFYHFVLPFRINNETPDTARIVFFKELKDRIRGMSMYDAALEVNHWCHEKVTYKGTDERTSAPLSTVKTAYGRCGEESTFTVAALRSVGIPARQVYTPRWAHTDDNHAWVEAWIDGTWYFMGACEPAPKLNMGWFAFPATRAIMMHTNVFGKYSGKEENLFQTNYITKINCLETYANTKDVWVKAVDRNGKPMKNVEVRFNVYNYAEFYPFAIFQTDDNGLCHLKTGLGDLFIEISDGKQYGMCVLPSWQTDTFKIFYANSPVKEFTERFTPPAGREITAGNETEIKLNQNRLLREDSIRNLYVATFPDSLSIINFMTAENISDHNFVNLIQNSRGNHQEILNFVKKAGKRKEEAIAMLKVISEKDLRDTPSDILKDHLINTESYKGKDKSGLSFYNLYVLNPRISYEKLMPWRSIIRGFFGKKDISRFKSDPQQIMDWIKSNIRIDNESNYARTPISPAGILKARIADESSANILFVAICRSFGLPSRLNPINAVPQYYVSGIWKNAIKEESKNAVVPQGTLVLTNADPSINLIYYTHFTIARFEGGKYNTLNFEFDTIFNRFPATLKLDTGNYRLLTGNRLADGSVITLWKEFKVLENQNTQLAVELARDSVNNQLVGSVSRDITLFNLNCGEQKLGQLIKPEGAIFVVLNPSTEPGKHILAELNEMKQSINEWKGNVVLATAKGISSNQPIIAKDGFSRINVVEDRNGELESALLKILPKEKERLLPYVAYVDSRGNCYFISSAYQINTISRIFQVIYCTKTCSHE